MTLHTQLPPFYWVMEAATLKLIMTTEAPCCRVEPNLGPVTYSPAGVSNLSPSSPVIYQSAREGKPFPSSSGYLSSWDQMNEQQKQWVNFKDALITTTNDGTHWRAAAFHP